MGLKENIDAPSEKLPSKVYNQKKSVYQAAMERIETVFDEFENVCVSFSAGKDSGVLLNLTLEVARRRNRLPLDVMYIDLEAQYSHTIDYATRMMSLPDVRPHWICLPLHLRNAVSQFQPHWLCWDPDKKDMWVRDLPPVKGVISDESFFPFFKRGMEFEEFVPAFNEHISKGKKTAILVGIRADESLNRFRTIKSQEKETLNGLQWTTKIAENVYNAYPIYDWRTEDIWRANGKFGWDYNKIYDLMHLAGVPLSKQRICQPYGDDQRRGLWLFKILEPETWSLVVNRVEGANFGARYMEETDKGRILGNYKIELPEGYTYKKYAKFLLATMPPHAAEHYRKKIFKFLNWWRKNGKKHGFTSIPDVADAKLEAARKAPSWRRICKTLLKNDWWCKGLGFSQTKGEMEKQLAVLTKYLDY